MNEPSPDHAEESPADRRGTAVFFCLLGAYLLMMIVGVALVNGGAVATSGGELPGDYAVFAVVNAATLTGFQKDVSIDLSPLGRSSGPILVLILTLGATLFCLIAGGMAVVRVARLGYSDRRIVVAALWVVALATVAGAIPLAGRGLLPALLGAAGAFGNSGLFVGHPPGPASWKTQAVLMPLALLGGLGLPTLMEIFDRLVGRRERLSAHSKTVLVGSAVVYLLGVVLLFSTQLHASDAPAWRMAASASAQAINTRSAGLPLEFFPTRALAVQAAMLVLMVVGAGGPGGTGGGVKVSTFARLLRPGRGGGYAVAWLVAYGAIALGGFGLLCANEPDMDRARLFFIAVSAASNVGLSHDSIALTGTPLRILSGLMLFARVTPMLILWRMAMTRSNESIVPG